MSQLLKNGLKLMSGSIVAQLISVLSIPIITRLYGAEQFGIFSIVLSISTILATIYLVGMHLAILIPKSEIESIAIVRFIMLIGTVICIFLLFIVSFFYKSIIEVTGLELEYIHFLSMPLLAFSLMISSLISFWGVRVKKYSLTSKSKVIESITDRGGSISSGFMGYIDSFALIVCKTFSSLCATVFFFYKGRLKYQDLILAKKKWPIKKIYYKYKSYLFFNTPSSVLTTFSLQLPLILLGICFSPLHAGLFAMANRLINIPGQTIGNTASKLVTQNISETWVVDKTLASKRTRAIYKTLLQLLLYPFTLLAIAGDKITMLFLGDSWIETGSIIQILAFLALTNLLVQSFGGVFDITKRQNKRLQYHIVNTVIRVLAIMIPSYLGYGFEITVIIFSIAGSIMNVVAMGLILNYMNCSLLSGFSSNINIIVSLSFVMFGSYFLNDYITSPLIFILFSIVLLITVFCCFSLKSLANIAIKTHT